MTYRVIKLLLIVVLECSRVLTARVDVRSHTRVDARRRAQ